MNPRYLIVGAGFSGAVLARELADNLGARVVVIDERSHIGGNCHTERDESTGIMVHRYGPHIFNTSNEHVWNYIRRFGEFVPFVNRVRASVTKGVFSLPINLGTINQFFGKRFTPKEAAAFIKSISDQSISEPANFEEQALKFVGRDLYETFFYGYTKKQWGCEPRDLPASLLKRLPIRFNYDDNYYDSRFQGIPRDGYSAIISRILDHPNIEVRLSTPFDHLMRDDFEHSFYTGPIDAFYGYRLGRLRYRTVYWNRHEDSGDFQGNAVINYTEMKEPFTRVHEHKHFAPWEEHGKTIAFFEFSKETEPGDIPYYPVRFESDLQLFSRYSELAQNERNASFLGRLATYRYLDMHVVIGEAISFSVQFARWRVSRAGLAPVFPNV